MARVDFILSNNRHHAAMFRPVLERLRGDSAVTTRLLSLCRLRGLPHPPAEMLAVADSFFDLFPYRLRRSPSSGASGGPEGASRGRRLARWALWQVLLGPRMSRSMRRPPQLVVVPNDAAFPYDLICRRLRRLQIPILLMQEGIRFPLPSKLGDQSAYGAGGAAAIAAWGESSAEYFRGVGALDETIHLTGSPRFDNLLERERSPRSADLVPQLPTGRRTLLVLSNPIDDLGYCSRSEKVALICRFLAALKPLAEAGDLALILKLHARESVGELRAAVADLPHANRIAVLGDVPLYDLLSLVDGAVVVASTVGLEALLFGVPLAVLEIPGVGYVFDYVAAGVAEPFAVGEDLPPRVQRWLAGVEESERQATISRYLDRALSHQGAAATKVAELIDEQCRTTR